VQEILPCQRRPLSGLVEDWECPFEPGPRAKSMGKKGSRVLADGLSAFKEVQAFHLQEQR
jgi:hypothetical protein